MSHVYSLAKVLALEKISGIDRSNKEPLVKDLEDKDEGLSGLLKGEGSASFRGGEKEGLLDLFLFFFS